MVYVIMAMVYLANGAIFYGITFWDDVQNNKVDGADLVADLFMWPVSIFVLLGSAIGKRLSSWWSKQCDNDNDE